ncbi:TetR/AcrR family transcriptional regulator [Rathayibacter sp. VKM Ac-2857]|uniref:TetR/AcrR family transcriptional regulator n=1 Tax=Rathayibacter sp. VKM Ac-2857 TaxID=2739020 RepID=UPI001564B72D|nr:TetR/AcrR family transcriptional regulator [Rathayibacter sp. VKM Ac-2857]NQX17331.1 TetR/AcrR family transcriptional regulator [Rathayibacter sp. VKM Ac-2857]
MARIRMSKEEIDREILDVAAGLLASHGIKGTSMQTLAATTGYSKAAMFARFETKELLVTRVIDQCIDLGRQALADVEGIAEGPARDHRAIEELTRVGLERPGFIALVIASVTTINDDTLNTMLLPIGDSLFRMFGLPTPPAPMDVDRGLTVTAALGALSVLVLNFRAFTDESTARTRIARIASASFSALAPSREPD